MPILAELQLATAKQIANKTNGKSYRNAVKWFALPYNRFCLTQSSHCVFCLTI